MAVLQSEVHGRVTLLRLHRPEVRNALSGELIDTLTTALTELDRSPDVGAIVLTGSGKVFCAGGDLKNAMSSQEGFLHSHQQRGRYAALLEQLPSLGTPVISAVNGDAMGGGLGLAIAADLVLANPAARFGTPEIRLGLFPWMILAVLQREVPRKKLAKIIYTGGSWTAEEALDLGLLTAISHGDVVKEALALAQQIASFSPSTLAMGKRALQHISDLPYSAALSHMHDQLTLNLLTDDAREGIAAFLDRRQAHWKTQ